MLDAQREGLDDGIKPGDSVGGPIPKMEGPLELMSTGLIFREVADKFDFVEISTLAIRLQIRRDSNPATVTPLLHWLSTKHNLIDLAKKAFPASESKSTSKKVKHAI